MRSDRVMPRIHQVWRIRRVHLLGVVALLLLAVAFYVRRAPHPVTRALRNASYTQLIAAVRADPTDPRAFYYLGLRLRDLGRIVPARIALGRAAQLDPDSEEICLAQSAVAGRSGATREAHDLLTGFLKRHPQSAAVHLELALFYHSQEAPVLAYREAMTVTGLRPRDAKAWRLAGLEALTLRKEGEAQTALSHAVALNSIDWRAQYALGQALHAQKRDREAIPAFQAAADLAPGEAAPLAEMGRAQRTCAANAGEIRQAEQTLRRAAALDPGSAFIQAEIGDVRLRQGRWREARDALQAAERLAPYQPGIHFSLIHAYEHLHDATAAARETHLLKEVEGYRLEKDRLLGTLTQVRYDPQIALKLARLCAAHSDVEEAARQYRRLLADPAHADMARRALAELASGPPRAASGAALPLPAAYPGAAIDQDSIAGLLSDGESFLTGQQYADAERAFRSALTRDPRSALAYQGLGLALDGQGRPEEAFPALNHAITLDKGLPRAQYVLAMIYFNADFPDEAKRRLERVIKQAPGNAVYLYALANCLRNDEVSFVRAEDLYRQAVALAPNNVEYLEHLAEQEERNHKSPQAETHYRRALQVAPHDVGAQVALGTFLLNQQAAPERQQEAERLLRSALASDPKNPKALLALGQLLLMRRDARGAVPFLEGAVLQTPRRKEPWYHLARAYDILGNRERAGYCHAAFRQVSTFITDLGNTTEAARATPRDPALRRKLARLYAQAGIPTKAINQYEVCLSLDSKNRAARKEMTAYVDNLKATGQMPDLRFFNAMIGASLQPR